MSSSHGGETDCRRQLWIDERGTSGDLAEVVGPLRMRQGRAKHARSRRLEPAKSLGHCDGNRPWLGPYANETCNEPNRLLIRTASNAYFPQLMSVISLPDRNENLREAVEDGLGLHRRSRGHRHAQVRAEEGQGPRRSGGIHG